MFEARRKSTAQRHLASAQQTKQRCMQRRMRAFATTPSAADCRPCLMSAPHMQECMLLYMLHGVAGRPGRPRRGQPAGSLWSAADHARVAVV